MPKAKRPKKAQDENLKSLAKIARLLECFSRIDRTLSLGEICNRAKLPKSTTHRLLASMRAVGFLDQDRERDRYRLGLKLFEFGNIVLSNMDLHREARPFVETLSRMSGHVVHLAVFDGAQAVVVDRSDPTPEGGSPRTITEAAPTHCTSVGKAILAFQSPDVLKRIFANGLKRYTDNSITDEKKLRDELVKIRARKYAVDNGEHQPGLRCIGAPIRDQTGRVFAGISISGPMRQIEKREIEQLSQVVMHHANAISASLGFRDSND